MNDAHKTKDELLKEIQAMRRRLAESEQLEAQLKESENRFRSAAGLATDLIYEWNVESDYLEWYGDIDGALGFQPGEVPRTIEAWVELIHPSDRQKLRNAVERHRRTIEPIAEEYQISSKDGSWRKWTDRGIPILDEQGRPIKWVGVCSDVTEERRKEEALRFEKQRFQTLTESAPFAMCLISDDGTFLYLNPGFIEMFGYDLNEVPNGRAWFQRAFPDSDYRARVIQTWKEDREKASAGAGRPRVFTVRCKDGSDKIIHFRPVNLHTGHDLMTCEDITARERMAQEIRESEELYRTLVETMNEGLVLEDKAGYQVFVNDRFAQMLGYSRDEMIGRSYLNFVEEAEHDKAVEETGKRKQGRSSAYELLLRAKDGEKVPVIVSAGPLYDAQGEYKGNVAVFTDITDRKKAEEALRRSESMMRSLAGATPVGLFLTENRRIKWANSEWEKMFGFQHKSEYAGQPTSIMFSSEAEYITVRQAVYRNLDKGSFGETYMELMRRDGSLFQAHLRSTYLDPSDHSKGTLSSISDVTKIVQLERARRESEKRYQILFENSRDPVYLTARDGAFLEANQAFCDLFGYDRNELEDLNAGQMYADLAHRNIFQEAIEKTGSINDYALPLRKKDGTEFEALVTASVRYGDKREILGYQGIIRDVTQQRQLERQLLHAQKMEAIGTLAGGIAHEFNNILQITLGFSELLLQGKSKKDQEYEDLQKIYHAAHSGSSLVRNLLTFSRKVEPRAVPLDLNSQIRPIEKLLSRTIPRMIEIRMKLGEGLKRVHADPGQIEQIVMNLALNARDAMGEKGTLTIQTENVVLDEEYCRLHIEAKPGEHVLLSVSDTGSGMDGETLQHIFEPFYTTKDVGRGTGLGLSMVHGIVKQHDGHLTCYSEVGKGTTFRIYLPAITSVPEDVAESTAEMPAFGTETLLLVDDEEAVRALGERILTKNGYSVLVAGNGKEALAVYTREREKISLIILDLIMPSMSGMDCLRELLKIDPAVKVLIASGLAANETTKECARLGAKGFVNKPFRLKELLQQVRKTLDES